MQLPSVAEISTWPTPNYDHPTHVRGPTLLIITWIIFPFALTFVALRIFTRIHVSKAFGIDDIFLLAAIIPGFAIAVLTTVAATKWGWNRHIWDVPLDLVVLGLKLTIAMECLFGAAVSFTKMSLLILTRRVMTSGTGILRHVAAIGMFVVACEGFVFNLVVIFTCSPVSDYWTLSLTPQKCINERTHLLIGGIINTVTDFLVFFLPMPTVLSLKLHRRQQILLCCLFGAGFGVCVAGTVRIYYAWQTTSTFDRTWVSYPLWISSVLELDIALICTSIPACKPFFSRYMPTLLGTTIPTTKTPSKSKPSHQSSSRGNSKKTEDQSIPSSTSKSIFSTVFELQSIPGPPSDSRTNSKQMLPLSYLDPRDESGSDRKGTRKSSTETIASSFNPPRESSSRANSSLEIVPTALNRMHTSVTRVDSRAELVPPPPIEK